MKLAELKNTLKEVVKEVIQEELKDILLEAVKSNKQPVYEQKSYAPPTTQPSNPEVKQNIRENYMNVLGDMKKQFTSGDVIPTQGLQVSGPVDTTSPNGKLPEGEVSIDQIMGIMNK